MDAINVQWHVVVTHDGVEIGNPVVCDGWNVWFTVAAFRTSVPPMWHVDAFAQIGV